MRILSSSSRAIISQPAMPKQPPAALTGTMGGNAGPADLALAGGARRLRGRIPAERVAATLAAAVVAVPRGGRAAAPAAARARARVALRPLLARPLAADVAEAARARARRDTRDPRTSGDEDRRPSGEGHLRRRGPARRVRAGCRRARSRRW